MHPYGSTGSPRSCSRALVVTLTDRYVDFGTIGAAALEMMAARRSITLSAGDRGAILGGMLTLPPHPEVPESLARLRACGSPR